MMKRRVVITGMGTVNPLGNSVEDSWKRVRANECGIGEIKSFDTSDFPVKLAGEVKDFNPDEIIGKKEARRMARFTQLAVAAADEAVKDSGIDFKTEDTERCGVIVSSGIGGLSTIEEEHAKGMEKGFSKVSPFFIPMAISNMSAGQIAIRFGLHAMCSCVVTACAGGNNAIGDAFRQVRDGYSDVMVCGGSESCITALGVGGFASLKALNITDDVARASIPFDKERNGFVIAEGAGILVIEELEHAIGRGAKIYAELCGYGANCDAYHITAPDPEGNGGAKCMSLALSDADMRPEDVDYINAHGTSTHMNDSCETKAVRKAFGSWADKLMVSSTKSMTGHMLGGAGAVEAVFTTLAVKENFVPATINYKVPDEECNLDVVPNEGRNTLVRAAVSNTLGFGGHNASLVIRKYEK